MLRKTITYSSIDGTETFTEDFEFNLSKKEAVDLQFSIKEGYDKMLEGIAETGDVRGYIAVMDDLVHRSFGRRSADGKRFVKRAEDWEEFASSNAYDELMMELMDPEVALAFTKAVLPWSAEAETRYQTMVSERADVKSLNP